mmetsp:Transcript_76953/g.220387  ORF Transcript_76953/g.220387 Transcript_76953/m.220387 type:complete len:337 (+) Transcript_76953:2606-3616(+)
MPPRQLVLCNVVCRRTGGKHREVVEILCQDPIKFRVVIQSICGHVVVLEERTVWEVVNVRTSWKSVNQIRHRPVRLGRICETTVSHAVIKNQDLTNFQVGRLVLLRCCHEGETSGGHRCLRPRLELRRAILCRDVNEGNEDVKETLARTILVELLVAGSGLRNHTPGDVDVGLFLGDAKHLPQHWPSSPVRLCVKLRPSRQVCLRQSAPPRQSRSRGAGRREADVPAQLVHALAEFVEHAGVFLRVQLPRPNQRQQSVQPLPRRRCTPVAEVPLQGGPAESDEAIPSQGLGRVRSPTRCLELHVVGRGFERVHCSECARPMGRKRSSHPIYVGQTG